MDPASWTEAGDGVTFGITVHPGPALEDQVVGEIAPDADPILLWSTYIDSKQNRADRRWHPFTVDLAAYGGRRVTLVFRTSPGPENDSQYDWAGWGVPRLLKTQP
jgi:hypothetical protein